MCNNNDDNDNNTFLQSFSKMFSKIKLSTFVKKGVLNTATLMHAELGKFYAIYLLLTMEMAQKWHLRQELLKSSSNWMT